MFNRFFGIILLLLAIGVQAAPGFRQSEVSDASGSPLSVAVWYPSRSQGPIENAGENPAFEGVPVIRNAQPLEGIHPLLVISHGYNGNWRNLSWIAQAMAKQGYIVAAPDHPGTTTFNQDPQQAKKLWRRPQDITRVIDVVINSPQLFGQIDPNRIAALGHSLGGWTVMSLAGAQFDSLQFVDDCQHHPLRGDCLLIDKLGIREEAAHGWLMANQRDNRIHAIVSLDLGMAPGLTQQSLQNIAIPVLILAAEGDKLASLPAEQESGYLNTVIKPQWREYDVVQGSTHFSFMQLCKPGAEALIDEETPGDGIVCQDYNGASRAHIHQSLVAKISAFLNSSLNYHAPAGEIP